ncbi:MAG: ATP-dependent helicase [Planctomycetota bacterium]
MAEPPPALAAQLARLDPEQRTAVLSEAPTTLVQAQVGSGKTTVLVHKLLVALAQGAAPDRVAVLTFTTHAARELRQRVAAELGSEVARDLRYLGTFHAVALAILRERRERVAVIDPESREDVWRELIAEYGLRVCYRKRLEKRLVALDRGRSRFGAMKRKDDLERLDELYRAHKRAHGLYDFDDLIREARQELQERPLTPGLEWLLVDELQDTNLEQLRFLQSLAPGATTRWFAVGDPNQVIYSWRGNTPQAFVQLGRRPGAVAVELPSNYRSTATILDEAEHVLPGRRLVATRDAGAPVRLVVHHDAVSEARYLAQRIPELVGDAWREAAVLARTRRQLASLELALRAQGLPVLAPPAGPSLAVRWVRRLLSSALEQARGVSQLLADVDYGLVPPALVRQAPRGTWSELLEHLRRKRVKRLAPAEQGALVRAIRFCARLPELGPRLAQDVPSARGLIEELELEQALGRTRSRFAEDLRQVEAALEVWLAAARDAAPGQRGAALARTLRKDPSARSRALSDGAGIQLLTFHAAKGLEFRHLFLSGLNEGLVPLARSEHDLAELREERRLFYVALTRAKDTLELSYHRQPDRPDVLGEPSPFLAEVSTVAPDLARPEPAAEPFPQGAQVRHPRYGAGEVVATAPRLRVRFPSGERTFLPQLASATLTLASS